MGPTLHGNFEKWEENEPTFIWTTMDFFLQLQLYFKFVSAF